ncbi:MAG: hypothetical protein MK193_08285 [Lentisphaeria bacterium]|nr:hypothetical protein [Lentisphaeria bacterium]
MPICSYLVTPTPGSMEQLSLKFHTIPECEVVPSTNKNLLLLLTETESDDHEKELQTTLKGIPEIECLALSFASNEELPK